MSAPRFHAPKDSLAAVAARHPFALADPIVSDPAGALEEVISRLIDAESALGLIGDAAFELSATDPNAAKAYSATEVLGREMKAIGALLDGVFRAVNPREKEIGA